MILKENLQLLLNKYFLSGLVEQVKWVIKDNKVTIKFITPGSDIVGVIICKDFNVKNGEIGIYNTTKLNRLLSIVNKELFVDIIKEGSTFTKLTIEDNQFSLMYSLANLNIIKNQPNVDEPPYDIIIKLSSEDILALIKAKNALLETKNIAFKLEEGIVGDKNVIITLGDENGYSDKISYSCKNVETSKSETPIIEYKADNFKEILNSNKEMKSSTISISLEGLMKIEFDNDLFTSTYFLIQNDNNN